ncbi:Hsp20/alpha crystallin family protein [Robertkochia solimangrovi]|uniref:Hsp20/alpha crystallin family protein n=1 Tax=Robertkochia solimangrovi TaxID=2213046 RepID=UPI00117FC7C9|nr:Hsp20/alpha crystallin family protein [Robertkochia solimangrovi]TRZ41261.1 Hsp20/alpha crystallin family protein [Robertkochia solimangrovi]
MSLIKFNRRSPWLDSEMTRFLDTQDFFNDAFWNKTMQRQPALNIKETEEEFRIELAAPGLTKKDFNISIEDGYLNISAEKRDSKEEKTDNYTRQEFNYNSFSRSLLLPDSVKEEGIEATYENGLLQLKLAKKDEAKVHASRSIKVS